MACVRSLSRGGEGFYFTEICKWIPWTIGWNANLGQHVLDLWTGDITHTDGALSLLRIVDLIIDKARAAYRKEIIRCLLSISENPTPSLIADTDLFGANGQRGRNELRHNSSPDYSAACNPVFGFPDLLRFFDRENRAFRDARFMHHRLCGLILTTRDFDDGLTGLLSHAWSIQGRTRLVDRILDALHRPHKWCVTADYLYDLEKLWTGKDRELDLQPFQNANELFLVSFTVESYFADPKTEAGKSGRRFEQWDQIHELTYVAIAHDAIPALKRTLSIRGGRQSSCTLAVEECPMVSKVWILEQFERIRHAPVKQSFAAAVARYKLLSNISRNTGGGHQIFPAPIPDRWGVVQQFQPSWAVSSTTEVLSAADLLGHLGTTSGGRPVHPSRSYFRTSERFSEVKVEETSDYSIRWASRAHGLVADYNVVLLEAVDFIGSDHANAHHRESRCLFVLDMPSLSDPGNVQLAASGKFLRTVLKAPDTWATKKNEEIGNFHELNWSSASSTAIASDIVQHTLKQYQLSHSMVERQQNSEYYWLRNRLKTLRRADWPFSVLGTRKKIVEVGQSYGLDYILQCIAAAFEKSHAVDPRKDCHPGLASHGRESSSQRTSSHLEGLKSRASKPQALPSSSAGGESSAWGTSSNVERPTSRTPKPQASPNPPQEVESPDNRAIRNPERFRTASTSQLPAPHEVIIISDSEDEVPA